MLRIFRQGMSCAAMAAALCALPTVQAQRADTAAAVPLPPQIGAARKVFLSNAGMDGTSRRVFDRFGEPDQPYTQLYAALKSWGRYELVAAPADADLVFEIRLTGPLADCGDKQAPGYDLQLDVAILDTRTHFRLWTISEPMANAMLKGNLEKNFSEAMANLVADIKKLPAAPAADPAAR